MTIDEAGFLSSEIAAWAERHRTDPACRGWFSLAERVNRLLQKAILALKVPDSDNQVWTATLLLLRGISSFQGTVVLAERGMTGEARTLVRSCFETLFYLGAVLVDPEFVEALVRDDAERRSKIAKSLLRLPDGSGLEQEHTTKLERFLNDLERSGTEPEGVKIFAAAKKASLQDIYETYYRGLSNDAAHPSITALNRHLKADDAGEIVGLHWGPDASDIGDTMNHACTAAIYLVAYAQQIVDDASVFDGFDGCWGKYKSLIEATGALMVA
jgi:Family of unknown function (DUF5677)